MRKFDIEGDVINMTLHKMSNKLFFVPRWNIAYRKRLSIEDINFGDRRYEYIPIRSNKRYAFADPLVYEDKNGSYLFVEAIDKNTGIGEIGVIDFNTGEGDYYPIIKEPFHMSYPYVFCMDNHYYMIPETNHAHQLRVYIAKDYPYKWELHKILIENIDCVDTTVFRGPDQSMLFVTTSKETDGNYLLFGSLTNDLKMDIYKKDKDANNTLRGAGQFFTLGDHIYRPTQKCTNYYGEAVILNKISFGEHSVIHEEIGKSITTDSISIRNVNSDYITSIHTLSFCDKYEFIDYSARVFSLTKPFSIILRKLRATK